MLERLEKAHLLTKESGTRIGIVNERNDYILSDPIPTLDEFLEVAAENLFSYPLLDTYTIKTLCIQNEYMGVSETNTSPCIQNEYDQQTLNTKQTSENSFDPAFEELRLSLSEK